MTSESRFRICLCVFRRDERRHPEDVFKLSNLSVNLSYQAQGQCAAAACYELVRIGRRDSTCKMQYTLLRVGSRVAYEHSDLLLRLLPLCLSVRVDDSTLSVQVWYSNIVMLTWFYKKSCVLPISCARSGSVVHAVWQHGNCSCRFVHAQIPPSSSSAANFYGRCSRWRCGGCVSCFRRLHCATGSHCYLSSGTCLHELHLPHCGRCHPKLQVYPTSTLAIALGRAALGYTPICSTCLGTGSYARLHEVLNLNNRVGPAHAHD